MHVRLQILDPVLEMIRQHPLTGVGVNQFAQRLPDFATWGVETDQPPHNIYLLLAAELGVPGMLCFAAIIGVAVYQAFRLTSIMPRLVAFGAACIAMGVNDLASFTMRTPPIQGVLWLMAGVIAGCAMTISQAGPQPPLAGEGFANHQDEKPSL